MYGLLLLGANKFPSLRAILNFLKMQSIQNGCHGTNVDPIQESEKSHILDRFLIVPILNRKIRVTVLIHLVSWMMYEYWYTYLYVTMYVCRFQIHLQSTCNQIPVMNYMQRK